MLSFFIVGFDSLCRRLAHVRNLCRPPDRHLLDVQRANQRPVRRVVYALEHFLALGDLVFIGFDGLQPLFVDGLRARQHIFKAAPAASGSGETVSSPMPGTILDVKVAAGQAVKSGDILFILEAMKMENEIFAPCDGTVSSVAVSKGAAVNPGDVLCVIG